MDKRELSLRDLGCDASCCKHGSPYVLPSEVRHIREQGGLDFFVQIDGHYIIGLNRDGSKRNMDSDPCPYLDDKNLCVLHDDGFKPVDCSIHPVFGRIEEDGKLHLYVNPCCDVHKKLPSGFVDKARELIKKIPVEHLNGMFNHQFEYGFPLIKLSCRK